MVRCEYHYGSYWMIIYGKMQYLHLQPRMVRAQRLHHWTTTCIFARSILDKSTPTSTILLHVQIR